MTNLSGHHYHNSLQQYSQTKCNIFKTEHFRDQILKYFTYLWINLVNIQQDQQIFWKESTGNTMFYHDNRIRTFRFVYVGSPEYVIHRDCIVLNSFSNRRMLICTDYPVYRTRHDSGRVLVIIGFCCGSKVHSTTKAAAFGDIISISEYVL